jgi:hypothetical protein
MQLIASQNTTTEFEEDEEEEGSNWRKKFSGFQRFRDGFLDYDGMDQSEF